MKNIFYFSVGLILGIFVLLFLPSNVFAELFINEFSSDTEPDWIEIYNSGPDEVDLSSYRLRDNTTANKLDLFGVIASNSFTSFDWSNRLNKDGDLIKLLRISDESIIDNVSYGNVGVGISAPNSNQSAGRQSDGGGNWVIFAVSTRGSTNNSSTPVSTPTLTPTVTPTPTNSPTPTKTPTPTKVPTPTKTPVLTKVPTSSPTLTQHASTSKPPITSEMPLADNEYLGDVAPTAVLGQSTKDNKDGSLDDSKLAIGKDSSKSKETNTTSSNNSLSIIFIVLGVVFIAACAILAFYRFRKSSNSTENG
ncbi:MAG: lamin tail domain-containing protein [Patescibacteria group bacterium]